MEGGWGDGGASGSLFLLLLEGHQATVGVIGSFEGQGRSGHWGLSPGETILSQAWRGCEGCHLPLTL